MSVCGDLKKLLNVKGGNPFFDDKSPTTLSLFRDLVDRDMLDAAKLSDNEGGYDYQYTMFVYKIGRLARKGDGADQNITALPASIFLSLYTLGSTAIDVYNGTQNDFVNETAANSRGILLEHEILATGSIQDYLNGSCKCEN